MSGPDRGVPASSPDDDWSGELLDLARAASGIGTFDWDLATGRLRWDARLLELFELTEDTFDNSIAGFNARLHPDDLPRVTALLDRAVATCGEYEADYRVVRADGSQRWVSARGRAVDDGSGTAVRLVGAAWDITDRRREQDRLAAVLESMAVGFIAMDTDWVMHLVNTEAERVTGMPRDALLGRTVWEAFPATVGTEFEESYRRAVATGQTVSLLAFYPAPLNVWVDVRAVPTDDGVALYFLDVSDQHRQRERQELLAEVTGGLTDTLDAEQAVGRLAELVVPALADWCLVSLFSDQPQGNFRRDLRDIAAWHHDPDLRELVREYGRERIPALTDTSYVARALTSGRPQVVASSATARIQDVLVPGRARDIIGELAPDSFAVLPLRGRGSTSGLLTLFAGPGRGPIPDDALAAAVDIAGRAGLALDNARLFREQRGLAEVLQRSLLTPPPEPDHAQVVVRYVPAARAAQVGGDWYDAFLQPGGALNLVIGDVIGHDTAAAAAMGQLRTIVRTIGALGNLSPVEVLARSDEVLQTLAVGTAATAAVMRLEQTDAERETGVTRVRWSNAGHPPPFLITPDGTVQPLTADRADLLLGVDPDARRTEHQRELPRDSTLVLYTDGLVERRDQDLDHGTHRLHLALQELAGRDLDTLCDQLLARMLPEDPGDDVALIAVHLHPQDHPRPPEAGPEVTPPTAPPHP